MSKITITISGDSLAELFASAAQIAALGGSTAPTIVVATSDAGNLTASTAPAATDGDDGQPDTDAPEFDSAGIPWDERIHAGTKGRNQDGTWKRRRNTSDVFYSTVMAELAQRSAGQAPTTAPTPPAPPAPPASPAPVGIVDQGPVHIPAAPPAPAPAVAPAANVAPVPAPPAPPAPAVPATPPAPSVPAPETVAAPPAPQVGGMDFKMLMPKIAQSINAGRFTNDHLKEWLGQWGLTDIGQLATDPAKCEGFYNWLKQIQPPVID